MQKPKGYWTKERCRAEALQHSSKADFRRLSSSAYSTAKRKGWIDDICIHMVTTRRPDGYWTKERVIQEALRYNTRTAFFKGASSAYNKAQAEGWMDDVCQHMKELTKPAGYWTKERCHETAKKYISRAEFLKNDASAYRIAQRNGWLNDICDHMHRLVREAGYWTKSRLVKIAQKYFTRNDFHLHDDTAYRAAQARGLLDEICEHMEYQVLPRNYWTKERIIAEAKKYTTRSAFMNKAGGACSRAQKEGWLDEVCAHMEVVDHGWLHCIYAITNKRLNKAYIGLTRQAFEVRMDQHKSSRNTTNSSKISCESDTQYEQLTTYAYNVNEIGEKENEFIERYIRAGWDILNSQKLIGKVGTQTRWNYQRCSEEADKHRTRTEFRQQSPKAYNAAKRHGYLDELCVHMIEERKPNGFWTKERCHEEALKYDTRTGFRKTAAYQAARKNGWLDEVMQHLPVTRRAVDSWTKKECTKEAWRYIKRSDFSSGSHGSYTAAQKMGWLDDVCSHMDNENKPQWNFDACRQEALKYSTRSEFKRESGGAYAAARRAQWLDDICKHMSSKTKPVGFWTRERCAEEALKYASKEEFRKGAGGAYQASSRRGWLEKICKHMESVRFPRGHWNKIENCRQAALDCTTRSGFKSTYRGAYRSAEKNEWLDDICSHMEEIRKPNNYWTKQRCAKEALKYQSRTEFNRGSNGAYAAAAKQGWIHEICQHMGSESETD